MPLLIQFQLFIGLIFITIISCLIILIFNNVFRVRKFNVVRFVFEFFMYVSIAYAYYSFIGYIADGRLNIFYLLSIILGGYIFFKFYYKTIDFYLKDNVLKIKTKFSKAIKLHYKEIGGKLMLLKVKGKKRDEKN